MRGGELEAALEVGRLAVGSADLVLQAVDRAGSRPPDIVDEAVWAVQPDVATTPAEVSLVLLDALHQRWVAFLRTLKPEDWTRTFRHPERGVVTLDKTLGLYAWHGRHHIAHVRLIVGSGV